MFAARALHGGGVQAIALSKEQQEGESVAFLREKSSLLEGGRRHSRKTSRLFFPLISQNYPVGNSKGVQHSLHSSGVHHLRKMQRPALTALQWSSSEEDAAQFEL